MMHAYIDCYDDVLIKRTTKPNQTKTKPNRKNRKRNQKKY